MNRCDGMEFKERVCEYGKVGVRMAEYIVARASVINRCNRDGKVHLLFTEKERPCEEAYLKEIQDNEGNLCSRFFIEFKN